MFRTIFNQVKRPFDLSALTAGYCTKAPVQQRRIRGKTTHKKSTEIEMHFV